jgi:hypothetical protein
MMHERPWSQTQSVRKHRVSLLHVPYIDGFPFESYIFCSSLDAIHVRQIGVCIKRGIHTWIQIKSKRIQMAHDTTGATRTSIVIPSTSNVLCRFV